MKIVVLDGYTLNPGDLSWQELEALGQCTIYDRTDADQLLERAQGASIVLTNKTVLDGTAIDRLSELQYIGVLATGYNVVNIEAAKRREIAVTNVPAYGTSSVAQLTFALLLELTHAVGHHASTVRDGRWATSPDFCYWDTPLVELDNLTLGIVGFGHIGRQVAKIGQAFGMNLVALRRHSNDAEEHDVEFVELDELLTRSDVVSLHCPLTPDTQGLINAQRLRLMKPSAFLLNTSRGPLINEPDLAHALNTDIIAGAGLDVLSVEPPVSGNPLIGAKNCIITPHIAWATCAARARLLTTAVANVRAFLDGASENRIV